MQQIKELLASVGIDAYIAVAGASAFVISFLTSKQNKLLSRLCDAVVCGLFSSSLVPVIEYFDMPSNFAMFIGVTIGYLGTEPTMDLVKGTLSNILSKTK